MEVDKVVNKDVPTHPYHTQLAAFKPNDWQLEEKKPEKYLPTEESKLTFVDTPELLDEMMAKLKQVKEIAIDLEHHSYRSFIGMVCLVQISTRTEDFIIDSLILKEELSVLNEVCTDPSVLKVLHGSHADIIGLQRDFGVCVVNMFDMFEAARHLKEKTMSLGHMLKEHCGVEMDKTYQYAADWRIRPLTEEMITYARQHVRYLLYIHDIFRNKIIKADPTKTLLTAVYKKSTELCGIVYVIKVFKEDSYKAVYKKVKKGILNARQLECFRLLYAWRDKVARENDESTGYTLSNKTMFQIAKQLPSSVEDITTCCNPMPALVEQNVEDIQTLVKEAIDTIPESAIVPTPQKTPQNQNAKKKGVQVQSKKSNMSKKAFCFTCQKPGHHAKDCMSNRYENSQRRGAYLGPQLNRGRMNPYARPHPHGGFGRGAFPRGGGGFGGRGAFDGGYGRGGYNEPIPQPRPLFGGMRPSFNNYNQNPWHPYY